MSKVAMKTSNLKGKVTITEVAQRAGVSVMTRVIRNQGSIAKDTKKKILAIIDELGYLPLQSARNLSSSFSKVIGMVIPSFQEFRELRQGYEYEYSVLIGMLNACNANGYEVNIQEIRDTNNAAMLVKRVQARQIGGYIIPAPATEHEELIATLNKNNIVFSTINAFHDRSVLSTVSNESDATYQMTRRMIELGHRRFAFVGGSNENRATRERQKGYVDAIQEFRALKIKSEIVQCGAFYEDGYREGLKLLSRKNRPTAVQCITDDMAAGLIAAASQLGIQLPQELSICGFDNFGLARKITPLLTTATLPIEEMAINAALQVIGRLQGVEVESESHFDCAVVYRDSIVEPA
jgi:LacI family transcriptional regulator